MPNVIPDFDHNYVLPPHKGDPTNPEDLSPYPCSTVDLVRRFATSSKRKRILEGYLSFRKRIQELGLLQGYQWLDGSFLEDKEARETKEPKEPKDLDLITLIWGYNVDFRRQFAADFPEFVNAGLSFDNYLLDHYVIVADIDPRFTIELVRYWIQLFTHNRYGVWKGMLQISLNTPSEDAEALELLQSINL